MISGEPAVAVGEGVADSVDEPPGAWRDIWRHFRRNRIALTSLAVMCALIGIALFGPLLYRVDPTYFNPVTARLDDLPTWAHPLGTDHDGRDILARLLEGLRVSLGVVAVVETLNVGLGLLVGLLAGYFGGWIDAVLARVADLLLAFPGLLLAFLFAGVFGPGTGDILGGFGRLALVAGSLALVSWPLMARYVRAETLSLRTREFVTAAYSMGVSHRAILWRHIIPNLLGLVLTAATLDMASVVVNEAVLSLLGLGVQPPHASIGLMINDAVPVLEENWTEALFPGAALTLMVLALSFLGDGLRDALDVRAGR